MATNALHALWAEPRPTHPPDRGPRDWALVAALICCSLVEAVLLQDLAPRPLLLLETLAVLGPLQNPGGQREPPPRFPTTRSPPTAQRRGKGGPQAHPAG